MPKVFIASDHRGFEKKQAIKEAWANIAPGFELVDLGPEQYNPEDDFNDSAIVVAKAVLDAPESFGVLLCGSSHGVCMQANRFKGIRAISGYDLESIELGRKHNDANVLCLPADRLDLSELGTALQRFLETQFAAEERYIRRNNRLDEV